jgi:hypothetical protein
MRHIQIFIAAIFVTNACFGQTQRQENETIETFIKRLVPDTTKLAHAIIETNSWDTSLKAIVAFYGYDDTSDINTGFNKIFGHIYLPLGKNTYRDISFGPIEEDGGYPEILSVFFSNADKDKSKELIVLCKYDQRHYDYGGEFYETFIFDNPGKKNQLTYLEDLSEKFWGCECEWSNGKTKVAKYKTAKDIKAGLKKMGF